MRRKSKRLLIFIFTLFLAMLLVHKMMQFYGNQNVYSSKPHNGFIKNDFKGTVDVWGKAAIAEYFWLHVFNEELNEVSGSLLFQESIQIQNIHLEYKSGPYLTLGTCNKNAENLIIILNGREEGKVNKARAWLDSLLNTRKFPKLKNLGIIMLGNEACKNSWLEKFLENEILKFLFVVYDIKTDSEKVFQWPLGVATYRHFPMIHKNVVNVNQKRKYMCNFLGTVYPNSSREKLKQLLDQETLNCYVKIRSTWLAKESQNSMDLYHQILKDSDFTLCPVGINSESYRIYESMSFGSIPILEDITTPGSCDSKGPYKLLKKYKAPVIYLKDWSELKTIFKEGTWNDKKIVDLRKQILEWYEIHKPLKYVLCYEVLFGKGIHQKSRFEELFSEHGDKLKEYVEQLKEEEPLLFISKSQVALPRYVIIIVALPRYVRVNVLKSNMEDVISQFEKDGYHFVSCEDNDVKDITGKTFMADKDIQDLLVFSPNTDLHHHHLYRSGKIFLQDKASCLSAFVLNPSPESLIIDGCAAPGNKTTHLACMVHNEGDIHAFDLDRKRLQTMQAMLHKAEATCVTAKHQDFLKVRHDDKLFSQVEYILLDPSCSGSGIVSRMDGLLDEQDDTANEVNERRLKSLSGFQTAALSHALTFPNVRRVLYSTCSIHKQENEDVVEKAYKRFGDRFDLCHVMPHWKSRGQGEWELAYKCIRAVPETDFTNGFFVAMFERKKDDEFRNGGGAAAATVEIDEVKIAPEKNCISMVAFESKNNEDDAIECSTKKVKKRNAKNSDEKSCGVEVKKIKKEQNDNLFAKKVPSRRRKRLNQRVKKPLV